MTDTILICTVGGSHQPIVTAIRETSPCFVCFICTGRDPTTGQPGSETQIAGKGNVIKAHPGDPSPTLPNIPTQTELAEEQFQICLVPSDDLDDAYGKIDAALAELKRRFPDASFIADYTGGTKTMSAVLVMVALETDGVELRLVTGARADLIKVRDGTETSVAASAEDLRLRRAMAPYLAAWGRYAYGEAWQGLKSISMPRNPSLRGDLQIARDLSFALDAWDRFDHHGAREKLVIYQKRVGQALGLHFTMLKLLTDPADERCEPARLWDLWRNAERRAAQGRSDGMRVTVNGSGELQAGLLAAWDLVAHHLNSEASKFAQAERNRLLDHLKMRNGSILAHGYTAVDRITWDRLYEWLTATFLPALTAEAARTGVRITSPQLPQQPVW